MKYFIDSKRPIDEATDIEREMPTRLTLAQQISRRYRTDAYYFYADRVGMVFIVDLDDADQLSEIVLLLRRVGLVPTVYPMISGPGMADIMKSLPALAEMV